MSETIPPPSYSEVVGAVKPAGSGEPSAPPQSQLPALQTPLISQYHHQPGGYHGSRDTSEQPRRASKAASTQTDCTRRGIDAYVKFSLAHTLRMNLEPDPTRQDPELDVEAQFSRRVVRRQRRVIANRMRLQCVSGWLWCIGVILVLIYVGVPAGMIITGVSGIDECPYRNNAIIGYLIGGGILLAITILFRAIPSISTIGKNHNWCNTRQSNSCSGGICALEVLFYILLGINILVLILGSFWVFDERPPFECPEDSQDCTNYCNEGVYSGAVIFLIIQYILLFLAPAYMCVTVSCNHCLRAQELE